MCVHVIIFFYLYPLPSIHFDMFVYVLYTLHIDETTRLSVCMAVEQLQIMYRAFIYERGGLWQKFIRHTGSCMSVCIHTRAHRFRTHRTTEKKTRTHTERRLYKGLCKRRNVRACKRTNQRRSTDRTAFASAHMAIAQHCYKFST